MIETSSRKPILAQVGLVRKQRSIRRSLAPRLPARHDDATPSTALIHEASPRPESLFPHKSQFQRGTTMSHPNHERRRNQTFRVELLESRALLSTAGVVSRPAAAIAPLARSAHFSSIAGDPKYMGKMKGEFRVTPDEIQFSTSGKVSGTAFDGGHSTFNGIAVTGVKSNGKITYTKGAADLANHDQSNMLTSIFKVTVHKDHFTLDGVTGSGSGDFATAHQGTIKGVGAIHPKTGTIEFVLTVHVPQL
jgi:hypothetical protein